LITVDASAVVALLVDDGRLGALARSAYAEHDLAAPELLPYEATNVLRRLNQRQVVTDRAARRALKDLGLLRVSIIPFDVLAERTWELRTNLSAYDAAYVAVAEHLGVPLLTFDQRLQHAPGVRCHFV
jgi:predicted nucleic acid-binding protein